MDDFAAGDLAIRVTSADAGALQLAWSGRGTDQQPRKVLGPYFERLLETASSASRSIEMTFQSVEHVNSSTITAIIQFIQDARTRSVPLAIIYDPNRRWQRLSFEALRVLVADDGLLELRTV